MATRINENNVEVVDVVCPVCGIGGEVIPDQLGKAVCGDGEHPDTVLVAKE